MAIELGKFISDKVRTLPKNHPDRRFLDGMLKLTKGYLSRENAQEDGEQKLTSVELIAHNARLGPYLMDEMLEIITRDPRKNAIMRRIAGDYLSDVREWGNDSIAHLCLPGRQYYALKRGNIASISDLKGKIFDDEFFRKKRIGKQGKNIIVESLKNFDDAVRDSRQ